MNLKDQMRGGAIGLLESSSSRHNQIVEKNGTGE